MTTREYYDYDGNPIDLNKLCRDEPSWAASQVRHRDSVQSQLERLRAAAGDIMQYCNEAIDCPFCDVVDGEHGQGALCAELDAALNPGAKP